jgi:hypothetical protein
MHKSKAALPVSFTFKAGSSAGGEDWAEPPLTANEYLARVRREAEAIPDLMLAKSDHFLPPMQPTPPDATALSAEGHAVGSSTAATAFPVAASQRVEEMVRSVELQPLDEAHTVWKAQALAQFAQLRTALANRRAAMDDSDGDELTSSATARRPVPQLRAAADWHLFCFGQPAPRGPAAPEGAANCGPSDADDEDAEADAAERIVDDHAMLDEGGGFELGADEVLEGDAADALLGNVKFRTRPASATQKHSAAAVAAAAAVTTVSVAAASAAAGKTAIEAGSSVATAPAPALATPPAAVAAAGVDWSNGGCGHVPTVRLLLQLDAGTATTRIFAHHVRWLVTHEAQAAAVAAAGAGAGEAAGGSVAAAVVAAGAAAVGDGSSVQAAAACVPRVARCQWLYALLARLPDPCHRDTLADVRTLYKVGASAYARLGDPCDDPASKQALAVLLLVAGRHFNQAPPSR